MKCILELTAPGRIFPLCLWLCTAGQEQVGRALCVIGCIHVLHVIASDDDGGGGGGGSSSREYLGSREGIQRLTESVISSFQITLTILCVYTYPWQVHFL